MFGDTLEEIQSEAHDWNSRNFGIFWTVNQFDGLRQNANLSKLRFWYVEIDGGSKSKTLEKIQSNLMPTMVVESKNGFHVYWACQDAEIENYSDIMEFYLIPFFNADPKPKDISRILRVPDYFHCKDPNDKHLVSLVDFQPQIAYTEDIICKMFPKASEREYEAKQECRSFLRGSLTNDLFERVYSMDCIEGLRRLSGTPAVFGEQFSFKPSGDGKYNILVDEKSTSCWIDRARRIGSLDRGGPTLWQWLYWYHKDHKAVYGYFKTYFPEVIDEPKNSGTNL